MKYHRFLFTLIRIALFSVLGFGIVMAILFALDAYFPLDMSRYTQASVQVVDKQGIPLRTYLSSDGYWRLPITTLPLSYQQLLISNEDKRFFSHHGVDFKALIRALWQNIRARRVVSGASTITMQTAKLLDPKPRTLKNKIIEMFRAWQLEQHFSKEEILRIYATLVPMGGNIEGVEAAARLYFNRHAAQLSIAETAWLVSLPQSPNYRRKKTQAQIARDHVLEVANRARAITNTQYQIARQEALSLGYYPFPIHAPHMSLYARNQHPNDAIIPTTLSYPMQNALEQLLAKYLKTMDNNTNLAAAIFHNRSNQYLAYVGSADYFSTQRQGQIDMLRAIRSPGSTLKPLITLFAMDWLRYTPSTIIDDTPIAESPYRPQNYDGNYAGKLTLADALIRSRNVPAVRLLSTIDPQYFVAALNEQGLALHLPRYTLPNLSIALGGVGIRADELLRIYASLARCTFNISDPNNRPRIARTEACQQLTWILRQVGNQNGRIFYGAEPVALKTGTSYGWRDLWIFAYTRDYTIAIWFGRPDGGYTEQVSSATRLIPILRDIVAQLPNPPKFAPPLSFQPVKSTQLPPPLREIRTALIPARKLTISIPINQAEITLPTLPQTLTATVENGQPPFLWTLNQKIIATSTERSITLPILSEGYYTVRVVDANAEQSTSSFHVNTPKPRPSNTVHLIQDSP